MSRILGVAAVEFLGVALTDGDMPVMVQPGEHIEVLTENGGFTFRHEDGRYYGTQEQTVDDVLENIVREESAVAETYSDPAPALAEVAQPVIKITYEDNDELMLIF